MASEAWNEVLANAPKPLHERERETAEADPIASIILKWMKTRPSARATATTANMAAREIQEVLGLTREWREPEEDAFPPPPDVPSFLR